MSKNIVMICGFAWYPKATVSARAFPMAQELVRRGDRVTILISPYDNLKESGREYEVDGVRVVNLTISTNRKMLPVTISRDFVQRVSDLKPDLVHIFKPKGFSGTAALLLEILRRWPVVVDCDDWEGDGGWNDVSDYSWLLKKYINFQEVFIPRLSRSVTSASLRLTARYEQIVAKDRLFYIPNGPKPSLAQATALWQVDRNQLKGDIGFRTDPLLVYAGHLNPADEPEYVLRVFAEVLARVPSAQLLIIGDGPSGPKMRETANALNLRNVHFTGWVDYDRYVQLVRAADLAFYPYPDSLIYACKCSGKIIEFMCLGKPIVTTAVGQNLEYIQDSLSGLLVPPGNVNLAADQIERLIREPDYARQLGIQAQERIWKEFSWGKLGDVLEQAYDRAQRR